MKLWIILGALLALPCGSHRAAAKASDPPKDRAARIDQAALAAAATRHLAPHFEGAVLLREVRGPRAWRWTTAAKLIDERLVPCSTFKIVNTLVALETGASKGLAERIKWDGRKLPIKVWQRDHDLRSAFKYSVVWYYQRLATRVGWPRMRAALERLAYGDHGKRPGKRRASRRLTSFWLDGSLRISAAEQLALARRLYRDELPFSARSHELVRELMEQAVPLSGFGGKTGSCRGVGWFVGHLAAKGGRPELVSVTLLRRGRGTKKRPGGPVARAITRAVLRDLGLLPGGRTTK